MVDEWWEKYPRTPFDDIAVEIRAEQGEAWWAEYGEASWAAALVVSGYVGADELPTLPAPRD